MSKLRKLIGIVLLAAVASFGVPSVLADTGAQESPGITSTGPQESPGVVGPQESPGIFVDLLAYLASTFIH
jgi:hypothetical protein